VALISRGSRQRTPGESQHQLHTPQGFHTIPDSVMNSAIIGNWRFEDVEAEFQSDHRFEFRSPSRGDCGGTYTLSDDVASLGISRLFQGTSPTGWYLRLDYDQPENRWSPGEKYCIEHLTADALSIRLIGIVPETGEPLHRLIGLTRRPRPG
jgi:hypothetical protein